MIVSYIVFNDTDTGEMYRYDGGEWIEYCEGGLKAEWQNLIYVMTDEGIPAIDMDVRHVAGAIASYLEYADSEDESES